MDPSRLLRHMTASLIPRAPGDQDVFGDSPLEDGDAATFGCWVYQTQRSEDTANADTQSQTWVLVLVPEAAGVVDGSTNVDVTVTATGDPVGTFEFDGPPWPAVNPRTGVLTHVEATVKKVA